MSHAPRPHDESVLRRWMSREAKKINDGIVADRKTLSRLLEEERPYATTKGGGEYLFDRAMLGMLAQRLPIRLHRHLRLPILFIYVPDVRDSVYTADEYAVAALQELGEISGMRTPEKGRLWVARPIVHAIMQAYPTAVQIAIGA
ncbi:MAG: hypothetical protein APR53_09800 [Methanoculleus sp. SDB]|nr:MAG: hypothetical protein APR53_09800 [Methanoculleus sp. SDB]